jgi:hypothetical protein
MLTIKVPIGTEELFDERTQEVFFETYSLDLEHSLFSLSKWESEFEKPFLSNEPRTHEEMLGYIRAMCLTPEVPPEVFNRLTKGNVEAINNYVGAKMTATWFGSEQQQQTREIITNEVIYHWLVHFNIPFEVQHWHLNRLLTLVRVCNEKNKPEKKLSPQEVASRNRALNAERKKQLGTTG